MSSLSSDLVMAWSYVLSISALRQPRSSTSASRARSRSEGLAKQFPHFLHAEGGVQMADRVRRDGRQHDPNRIRMMLRSRPKVALRSAEQAFEDDAEAGVLELPFTARKEDRFVVIELLQPGPAVQVDL